KKGRAARSALIASTMHRSSRQASRAAVMKAVAADLIREQRRVISEVVRVPHGDRLTEERVSHKGRFYTVNDAGIGVKPIRPGGPPVYIAAQAEVSVRRAARIGDAWLIVNSSGLGKVSPLMQTYRAALKEYGRTPREFPITVECYVGERHATAHQECRGPLEYKYNAYAAWGL